MFEEAPEPAVAFAPWLVPVPVLVLVLGPSPCRFLLCCRCWRSLWRSFSVLSRLRCRECWFCSCSAMPVLAEDAEVIWMSSLSSLSTTPPFPWLSCPWFSSVEDRDNIADQSQTNLWVWMSFCTGVSFSDTRIPCVEGPAGRKKGKRKLCRPVPPQWIRAFQIFISDSHRTVSKHVRCPMR